MVRYIRMNDYVIFLLFFLAFIKFFIVKLAFIFLIHYFCKIILQEIKDRLISFDLLLSIQ